MRLKLVSQKDTLLGHIDVPGYWKEWFEKGGVVSAPKLSARRFLPQYAGSAPAIEETIVTVAKAHWSHYQDAVYIARGTVEEFEELAGCSFIPSAAYLRSHLNCE